MVLTALFLASFGGQAVAGHRVYNDEQREHGQPTTPFSDYLRGSAAQLWIYENSLSLAFLILFLLSIAMHANGGLAEYNEERLTHGEATVQLSSYLRHPQF